MIKKNTSAFRKPIDRKTEDYVIVKGSKTKAMPEHKNNVKFFLFFFFSGKKVNWYIIAKYHLFLKWFVVKIGLYLVSSHSGSSLYSFFIENNSFFRGSLLNVSFIKTTVSVEGVLQLSLHFIMIIIYMYVIKYKIKSIGETVNLQYPCSISVISLKVNVGNWCFQVLWSTIHHHINETV